FDPPLIVEGPDAANGILKVWRYIPTLGGWGLIGLAALMAGAGAWMVRRRKRQ
ncbi:MAG: IPTL-CTERM sorting domain-containing protein, partial [Deltaproteobacteria bacterium]|nr:IPTL-CTERM sorting domain-containing protein [Deltaproteobacteria bacterium]